MSDDLARRIATYLVGMLERRLPERDVPLGEALSDEFSVLSEQEQRAVAQDVAVPFASNAEVWDDLVHLASIYFHFTSRPDKAASGSRVRRNDGKERFAAEVKLDRLLLAALLRTATEAQRITFFERVDHWETMQCISDVLPDIELTLAEALRLLARLDERTGHDMARGMILKGFVEWAGRHVQTAKDVADHLVLHYEPAHFSRVQLLVEGVVRGSLAEIAWREQVVRVLRERNVRALALRLECFAWPEDARPTPAAWRELLRLEAARDPSLVTECVLALERFAREAPVSAVEELESIVPFGRAASAEAHVDLSARCARVFRSALWASRTDATDVVQGLIPHLSLIVTVPPAYTTDALDSVLSDLWVPEPRAVEMFLEDWLRIHADALAGKHERFGELFPLLAGQMKGQLPSVVVRLLVFPIPVVRLSAIRLFADLIPALPSAAFAQLDDRRARAVAHVLAASGLPGGGWVRGLYQLGVAHPHLADHIGEIARDQALEEYPGATLDGLPLWTESGVPALQREAATIAERDAERIAARSARSLVPELLAVPSSESIWVEVQSRQMRRAYADSVASGRHALLAMFPRIPIVRGEGTVFGQARKPTAFSEIRTEFEVPHLSTADPVAGRLRRMEHARVASELLAAGDR